MPRPAVRAGGPFLGAWKLLGPFTAKDDLGPSRAPGSPGWRDFDERTINRSYDDYNDLHLWLRCVLGERPTDGSIVYATAWFHLPMASRGELRFGASGPAQAWWDEEQVLSLEGWTLRRDAVRRQLNIGVGWHRLLLRLEHAGGPWGFYARITDSRGDRVASLTASPSGPGELRIDTAVLPRGYADWPYVGLENPRGDPRASPYELSAGGGEPPYRWSLLGGELPGGVRLSEDGAICGKPDSPGRTVLRVGVRDTTGARAERSLELEVQPSPTGWHDENPLGVFVHFDKPAAVPLETWDSGLASRPGYAEQWATLAQRAGAAVLAVTAKHHDSWANWPTEVRRSDGVPAQRTDTDSVGATRTAATARGLRFGIYFSTLDTWHPGYRSDWPDYLRFQFRQLEELIEAYRPSLVWLDGHWDAPQRDWAYDPLFSLVHGLVPEAVIANNPGRRTFNVGDTGYGDVDVRTFEGHGYWDHMPARQRASGNPRRLAAQKFAFTCNWWAPGLDPRWLGCERNRCWREWIRVLSRLVGDAGALMLAVGPGFPGAPDGAPEPGELYAGAREVLDGIGSWLYPGRAEAFVGVRPGPIANGRWGVCVQRPGRLYLQLPPGRADGWPRPRLRVGPLPPEVTLSNAFVLPTNAPVPYTRSGDRLTLELCGLAADPVLSIVAIDMASPDPA
jgi:hypothetical protein